MANTPGLFMTPGPGMEFERQEEKQQQQREQTQQVEEEDDVTIVEGPQAQPGPDAAIDIDDAPEQTYLKHTKSWVIKGQEYKILQKRFSEGIKKVSKLAMPETEDRQRLEEIIAKVLTVQKAYIISRYKSSWKALLSRVRNQLRKELNQATEMHDQLRRPSSMKHVEMLVQRLQKGLDKFDEWDEERQKVLEDLNKLAGSD